MDKFNEDWYSIEDAQNEAKKIRQKIGKENAFSDEYDRAENLVEIEKRSVVEAPISDEAKRSVNEAYHRAKEIDEEIIKRAEPLMREIYAKLGKELGKEEAWDSWRKIRFENDIKSREAVDKWIKEIYEGKYGQGEVAIDSTYGKSPRLVRVISIQNPTPTDFTRKHTVDRIAKLVNEGIVERVLRPSKEGSLFKLRQDHKYDTSFGINLESHQGDGFLDVKNFFDQFDFAEVDSSRTTDEEIDTLYRKLLEKGWLMSGILEAFPKDYKPKVKVGEILDFGRCSHHSGEIEGKQIVLPTGRLAVVSKYDGEYQGLFGTYQFWGVLTDPNIEPNWSARLGSWEGPQLGEPTSEEIIFLKGMNVEFPNDKSLEEKKLRTIESGEE